MLMRCLHGLSGAEAEIIVSDDSDDDRTRDMITREFPAARWLQGPRRGPAANRNCGARSATGDWIAFVDDDCEPQPGWLMGIAQASRDADVIEGRVVAPGASDSPFEEHVENLRGGVLWSCNIAVRREVFERLAGFEEGFREAGGEDMEFAWRVARGNFRVKFAPEALIHHPPRHIGWRGLWRRTWMIRWMSLYRLKTGQARSLPGGLLDECKLLLRQTAQLTTRRAEPWPRRRCFTVAWRWFTFPLVLPYILYWDWRFRRDNEEGTVIA